MIKSVSLYKRDERCLFLYVHQNSDDFQMIFPSARCRQMFYDLVLQLTADLGEAFTDLDSGDATPGVIRYEYEFDDQSRRVILGKGRFFFLSAPSFSFFFSILLLLFFLSRS